MQLTDTITEIVGDNLENEQHFLVDVLISAGGGPKKIQILIDGDEGIDIDTCASLSRTVAGILEEKDLVDIQYTLEVSSPGVDYPLKSERQFQKNIGRWLKLELPEGPVVGKLKDVTEGDIVLEVESGKGKNKTFSDQQFELNSIQTAKVEIRF